jgi:hypothetical protein
MLVPEGPAETKPMKRLIFCTPLVAAMAALTLAACETAQPMVYAPAAGPQAVGYAEQRIEPGRYRIFFQGARGAPPQMVADYALRRAADLALADGYDWFQVYDRQMSGHGGHGPYVSLGVGGASFGHSSATGVGVSSGFDLSGPPSMTASLEVVMGRGPRPPGPDVYDARGVQQSIRLGA